MIQANELGSSSGEKALGAPRAVEINIWTISSKQSFFFRTLENLHFKEINFKF